MGISNTQLTTACCAVPQFTYNVTSRVIPDASRPLAGRHARTMFLLFYVSHRPSLSNAGVKCSLMFVPMTGADSRIRREEGSRLSLSRCGWVCLSQPSSTSKSEDEVKSVASDEVVFSGRLVVRPGVMFVNIFLPLHRLNRDTRGLHLLAAVNQTLLNRWDTLLLLHLFLNLRDLWGGQSMRFFSMNLSARGSTL